MQVEPAKCREEKTSSDCVTLDEAVEIDAHIEDGGEACVTEELELRVGRSQPDRYETGGEGRGEKESLSVSLPVCLMKIRDYQG